MLAIGDPRRSAAGRAVIATLLVAAMFAPYALAAKEIPALYQRVPWHDDPYDTLPSFTIFFVPLLAGLILLRIPLCRREIPLPTSRVVGVLRACRVALAAVLLTAIAEWASVALRANMPSWDWTTVLIVALLAVITAAATAASLLVRHAAIRLPGAPVRGARDPDWVTDVFVVAEQLAGWLGPFRATGIRLLHWLDERIMGETRRHPITAAAAAALLFGVALAGSVAREEGLAPVLLLFIGVAASGMFAFLVTTGAYLGLVRSAHPAHGAQRRVIDALVVSAASVPVALAFREWLGWIAGSVADDALRLTRLLITVAAALFVIVLAGETAGRAYAPKPRR